MSATPPGLAHESSRALPHAHDREIRDRIESDQFFAPARPAALHMVSQQDWAVIPDPIDVVWDRIRSLETSARADAFLDKVTLTQQPRSSTGTGSSSEKARPSAVACRLHAQGQILCPPPSAFDVHLSPPPRCLLRPFHMSLT